MSDKMTLLRGVKKLKQAGVRLEKECVIYVDPFNLLTDTGDAACILITHAHYDHYSPDDIRRVMRDDTTFVAPLREAGGRFSGRQAAGGGRGGYAVLLRDWD